MQPSSPAILHDGIWWPQTRWYILVYPEDAGVKEILETAAIAQATMRQVRPAPYPIDVIRPRAFLWRGFALGAFTALAWCMIWGMIRG